MTRFGLGQLVLFLAIGTGVAPATDLYVAPGGDDANPGTAERPLATLAAARDRLRPRLATMGRDLVVTVRAGRWYLTEPFRLTAADSGRNGHQVVYQGEDGSLSELIGGVPVTGWEPAEGPLWSCALPPGTSFNQLFCNDQRLTLARHPNDGYLTVEAGDLTAPTRVFGYAAGDLPAEWDFGPEAQVFIWSGYDWFSDTAPIRSVDYHQRVIELASPVLVPITRRAHRRYFLQGVRGALDAPGEWFLDRASGRLWLWPPEGVDLRRATIVRPTVPRVIAVEGEGVDQPARALTFRNLRVAVSRFGDMFNEIRGTHGQTTWNEPANLDAAIYLEHAQDVVIDGCEVAGAGYSGISLTGASQRVTVTGSWIHDCGFHGVLLQGYAPRLGQELDHNHHHQILGCHIHDCGRLVGHGGGVFIHSSGDNRVANCEIHHMPRYGICSKGGTPRVPEGTPYEQTIDYNRSRNNVYEFNDIHHVNQDSEDSGFISFHTTGKGNVIRGNLLHDCVRDLGGLSFGIYLDDGAGYFQIDGNIIWNIGGGSPDRCMTIYAKGIYNTIENNILVGEERTGAAINAAYMFGRRADHHIYRRNVVYQRWSESFAWRHQNWIDERMIESDHNLFWNTTGEPRFAVRDEQGPQTFTLAEFQRYRQLGFERNSLVADPLFVDPDRHDYRLRPDSPAITRLGFQPIDPTRAGLPAEFRFPHRDR